MSDATTDILAEVTTSDETFSLLQVMTLIHIMFMVVVEVAVLDYGRRKSLRGWVIMGISSFNLHQNLLVGNEKRGIVG